MINKKISSRLGAWCVLLLSLPIAASARAQSPIPAQDGLTDIQRQLVSLYPTAKATADGTDLVTAGVVLVLQKDHLVMSSVNAPAPMPNYYKSGAISQNGLAGMGTALKVFGVFGAFIPGAGTASAASAQASAATSGSVPPREFVSGEKFFVTRIDTKADGVTFWVLSDPIRDQRYRATLKFPFPKGTVPSPDDVASMVAEVLKIDAPPEVQEAPAPAPQALPPPVQTKTIALGQSRDEVVAAFGVPSKVVQLGSKEIDYFPDMKVTFVKNKVANVD